MEMGLLYNIHKMQVLLLATSGSVLSLSLMVAKSKKQTCLIGFPSLSKQAFKPKKAFLLAL